MIALDQKDDLKTLVEKAIVNLLEGDPVLATCIPREQETYIDREPSETDAGLQSNPLISVTATGKGTAVKQTSYRTILVDVTVKLEPNEETIQAGGIRSYFRRIENILDSTELHVTINVANNQFFICEGTYDRSPGEPKVEDKMHEQTYSFTGIFIAQPGYLN